MNVKENVGRVYCGTKHMPNWQNRSRYFKVLERRQELELSKFLITYMAIPAFLIRTTKIKFTFNIHMLQFHAKYIKLLTYLMKEITKQGLTEDRACTSKQLPSQHAEKDALSLYLRKITHWRWNWLLNSYCTKRKWIQVKNLTLL